MSRILMKNIDKATVLDLKELVQYQPGQIVSKTITQNRSVSITLFAFDRDEEISSHASSGDAMVSVLDGAAQVTVGGVQYVVKAGETIVMPAEVPHAVQAVERMKFMLTVVF